jgi:hypothetical protein
VPPSIHSEPEPSDVNVGKPSDTNSRIQSPESRIQKESERESARARATDFGFPNDQAKIESEFERLWAIWGRKDEEEWAYRAYVTARRKVSLDVLIDAAQRNFGDRDPQFYPNLARWLRNERWTESPPAQKPKVQIIEGGKGERNGEQRNKARNTTRTPGTIDFDAFTEGACAAIAGV